MTRTRSQEQRRRDNAKTASAQAQKKQEPAAKWTPAVADLSIARLKAMLDDIDKKYEKRP